MLNTLMKKMFGSRNERTLRRMQTIVQAINGFETQMQSLSDTELAAKTNEFKARIAREEYFDFV